MRVWTIQTAAWWQALESRGVLGGDGRRADPHFRPAYRWLMEQMARRLPGYDRGYPVWLWLLPKPDLRHTAHLARGQAGVRVELELPPERILPLDFETWHFVLNRWYLPLTDRESRDWERRTKGLDRPAAPLPPPLEAERRATWERVFDLEALNCSRLWKPVTRIQAVTPWVHREEVLNVDRFVAR